MRGHGFAAGCRGPLRYHPRSRKQPCSWSGRERLLQGLATGPPSKSFKQAMITRERIPSAFAMLGGAARADRVYLFKERSGPVYLFHRCFGMGA